MVAVQSLSTHQFRDWSKTVAAALPAVHTCPLKMADNEYNSWWERNGLLTREETSFVSASQAKKDILPRVRLLAHFSLQLY